jgi:predicted DNA-binding transcriptional regulator AlpA
VKEFEVKINRSDILLNTAEVAAMLKVKVATLEKARSIGIGDFPPYVKFGRNVRYRLEDVLNWIAAHLVEISGEMSCA